MLTFVVGASWPGVAAAAVVFDAWAAWATNQTTATFSFHSTPSGGSFQCSLDSNVSSAFTACTSPKTFMNVPEGAHTFYVREVTTGTSAPVSRSWTVDLTPPTTLVTAAPPSLSNSTTSTFVFSSPDSTAGFSLLAERRRAAGVRVARRLFRPG